MKPLNINSTHVTNIHGMIPGPSGFILNNPLSSSPAAVAFAEFSEQLADRLTECATRISNHADEVATFGAIVARADEDFAEEML